MKTHTMHSLKQTGLVLVAILFAGTSMGQKKNETSAAVEFKNNYMTALATKNTEEAKKSLIAAKEFIDLAAEHEETKNSQKTLWLKGEIYSNFMILGMEIMDTNFVNLAGEDALDKSIAAFAQGWTVGGKMKGDIKESCQQKADMLAAYAGITYKAEQYAAAAELYELEYRYIGAVGELDSAGVYNASFCYEKAGNYQKAAEGYERLAKAKYRGTTSAILASSAYRKAGNIEKAKSIIDEARKGDPSNKELLLELVNTNIDAGDAAGAEKALNDAIATDPNNKQLYYTIGTIYIDLKENEKAEAALNKALEIDPNYVDAQYQLGAHLVTWASTMNTEAKQLPFGDPNYNKMLSESEDIFKRALIPLEKYIASNPDDKQVLTILFQIHRNLGNSEKALEYKRRADAAE